jgi:putative phage-type endonuclease
MKIIDLEQGSKEWLAWRKTVITATDCPAILGSSPWCTAYKCWQRKLGLVEEQKTTKAMERGKKLEPIIRDRFIKRYGINMTPHVVESSEYEFLGASLDGLSDCKTFLLEIKTGGYNLYKMAEEGIVPEYYMHQIQHQFLVTGASKCFYVVGEEDEKRDIVIEVSPDPAFCAMFLLKARAFWKGVAFSEPPPLVDSDYKIMDDSLDWQEYAKLYQETDTAIKSLEEKKDYLRKKIIELCADENCLGNGLRVMKIIIRGRIAYDEIPEIKSLNLDKYRKSSTTGWKIMIQATS